MGNLLIHQKDVVIHSGSTGCVNKSVDNCDET
jgi:hypothetical protein